MKYSESLNKAMKDRAEGHFELVEDLAELLDELSSTIHEMSNSLDMTEVQEGRRELAFITAKSEVLLSVLKESYSIMPDELKSLQLKATLYYKAKFLSTDNYEELDF